MVATRADKFTTIERPKRYADFSTNVDAHPDTGDLFRFTDANAVKRALKNLLFTNKYERFWNPDFGCGINSFLFDNFGPDTQSMMIQLIKEQVAKHEPRVNLLNIEVVERPDSNGLIINLVFSIVNIPEQQSMSVTVSRVR